MTYSFQITNQTFTGHTVPGSARIQVHNPVTKKFVATFNPDVVSLTTETPSGEWVEVVGGLSNQKLAQLEPQLLQAARSRLLSIRKLNERARANHPELFQRNDLGWSASER